MALTNKLTFLYNLRCCIGTLSYNIIMKEIVGNQNLIKDINKLQYLEFAFCAISSYDEDADENCFTEDEIDLIVEQVNQICGCCNCGSSVSDDIESEEIVCTLYEEEFSNLTSGNTVVLSFAICQDLDFWVFRNGQRLDSFDEYSVNYTTKTVTFAEDFAISVGGQGGESVTVKYYK